MSAKQNILKYLSKGKDLTTKQALVLFKIKNVSARISELRKEGHTITVSERKLHDGRVASVYRLGATTPTKGKTVPVGA